MKASRVRAFSIVELLVVLAIVAAMIGLTVPAINSSVRAMSLSNAEHTVLDQLNYARQAALCRNLPVEVRLYKLPDYGRPPTSSPSVYRALQVFTLHDSGALPLGKPCYFSAPVVCSAKKEESSLLDTEVFPEKVPSNMESIGTYANNYLYKSIVFRPNGAAVLPASTACLTLVLENDKPLSAGTNFSTVQIDAVTGRVRVFRP